MSERVWIVKTGTTLPELRAERGDFVDAVRAVALPLATATDRIDVVGAPVAESLLGRHILEDLVRLVPVAMGVLALVVFVGCRRLAGVALGASWRSSQARSISSSCGLSRHMVMKADAVDRLMPAQQ